MPTLDQVMKMKVLKMTEEVFEARLCVSHRSGEASATDFAAEMLRDMSGEAYKSGLDDKAAVLRDAAKLVESRAKADWAIAGQAGENYERLAKANPISEISSNEAD